MQYVKTLQHTLLALFLAVVLIGCEFKETIVFNKDASGSLISEFYGDQMEDYVLPDDSKEMTLAQMTEINPQRFNLVLEPEKSMLHTLSETQILVDRSDMYKTLQIPMHFSNLEDLSKKLTRNRSILSQILINYTISPTPEELEADAMLSSMVKVDFYWEDRSFKRVTSILDKVKYQSLLYDKLSIIENFSETNYILEYSFPYKIESVSHQDAEISKDGKSVTLKQNALRAIGDPNIMDFEITLTKSIK